MQTPNITPSQAMLLISLIPIGHEVGVDSNGDMVFAKTKLSEAMETLGLEWRLTWADKKRWEVEPVVAMLRDWSNALEKLNER